MLNHTEVRGEERVSFLPCRRCDSWRTTVIKTTLVGWCVLITLVLWMLMGCGPVKVHREAATVASQERNEALCADYTLVYLKTGPKGGRAEKYGEADKSPLSAEEQGAAFQGHMANIQRLAGEGKLLIAGPFEEPRDKSWRGIFVLSAASVETARKWVQTDPAVAAGIFVAEIYPMRGSPALQRTGELERGMLAEQQQKEDEEKLKPESGGPPPNLRKYVMITVPAKALEETTGDKGTVKMVGAGGGWGDGKGGLGIKGLRTVWRGHIGGRGGDGVAGDGGEEKVVFVVDAKRVEDVTAMLIVREVTIASLAGRKVDSQLEGWSVDGWWSTTSLERLPEE